MSGDMSTPAARLDVPDRKEQILRDAVEIIANEGYGALTMRALARASGIKLGALQYHFRTWEELLRALAAFIGETYRRSVEAHVADGRALSLQDFVRFIFEDEPGQELNADHLFPQLWAMARIEPAIEEVLDEIYTAYLRHLEERLRAAGRKTPRADALALLSLLEGSTLFVGRDRRWSADAPAVRDATLGLIEARFGGAKRR